MKFGPAVLGALLAGVLSIASACGPVRLDGTPHIRGTVVFLDGQTLGIKHKTGGTYYVQITRETKIVNNTQPGSLRMCPGQRATVLLTPARRFTASSVTLRGGQCR